MLRKLKKRINEKKFEQLVPTLKLSAPPVVDYHKIKQVNHLKKQAYTLEMQDLVDRDTFCDSLKSVEVNYANSSNATQLVASTNFGHFINRIMPSDNEKYVFHNALKDDKAKVSIPNLIPIPRFINKKKIEDLRISRLYAGGKYSGTNLHIHSCALNYLVSGTKLWIMFPNNEKNNSFVDRHKMRYGDIKESALSWFLKSHHLINRDSIDQLYLFKQNEKEVVYVPAGWHHAVINLNDSIGITYSWV